MEHMPDSDRAELDTAYLLENLELALKAPESFAWASARGNFFNDVLPYAYFDEIRERRE